MLREAGLRARFPMKQMSQAGELNLKSPNVRSKRKLYRKLSVYLCVFGLMPAGFLYWRYLDHLTHVRTPAAATRPGAATASATGKSKPAGDSLKPDDKPALAKSGNQAAANDAPASFVDSLMSIISPSAQAVTMQPEFRPVHHVTKPAASQAIHPAPSIRALLPMTAEQKRRKLAQDGFDEVMDLAYKYPDAYGFLANEDMRAARLGDPIPVYLIEQTGRTDYAGQTVTSLLKPADEWVFPIMVGNHIRFMVQVQYNGHDYVLGHGSRALAIDFDKIVAHWPASEGFHPQLVIHPNRPFYYFTISELPEQNLTDTGRMVDFNPSLTPAKVILAGW